jgi:hypothetical protein
LEHPGGGVTRINTAALNAASRAVGEVRRSLGARIAAAALPEIFSMAGINIPPTGPDQREFDFPESDDANESSAVNLSLNRTTDGSLP